MRDRTNYLRGIAILAVILGHWFGKFVPEEYAIGGNGLVSVFFFLSGYGNYFSLQKVRNDERDGFRAAIGFYVKKMLRIYPLYWIAISPWLLTKNFDSPFLLTMGIKFTDPDIYWFVHSIVLCYILTFLLHSFIVRSGRHALVLLLVFIVVSVGGALAGVQLPRVWSYRSVLFNGVFLYGVGIFFAHRYNEIKLNFRPYHLYLSFILLVLACVEQKFVFIPFYQHGLVCGLAVSLASICFCSIVIKSDVRLFGGRWMAIMGSCSYSLYLFHTFYLKAISSIIGDYLVSSLIMIGGLAIFVGAVYYAERWVNNIVYAYIQKPALAFIRSGQG